MTKKQKTKKKQVCVSFYSLNTNSISKHIQSVKEIE